MTRRLRFVTYNIRKGKGASGRSTLAFSALSDALAERKPDVVLVQEAFHCAKNTAAHSSELAERLGMSAVYEPNKHRRAGHHGNATVTRHAVAAARNYDISTNAIERRGALYAKLDVHGRPLHVVNVHLGLNQWQRTAQMKLIEKIITAHVPHDEPLVLAGDFNDWNQRIDALVRRDLGLDNAFAPGPGPLVRTWPSRLPVFALDRVYTRNVRTHATSILSGDPWDECSDHLPLWAELELP